MNQAENKTYHKINNLSDLIEEYDAFLFDIWGVLHEGGELYEGIPGLFNKIAAKKTVRIISNAPRLKSTTAQNLMNKNMEIDHDMMFTSGEIARLMLNNSAKYLAIDSPVVFHLGEDRNKEILENIKVNKTENLKEADLILLSAFRYHGEDHDSIINVMKEALVYKLPVLCANPDNEVLHLGNVSMCAGYFARIYEGLGGKVFYSGKPEKLIFEQAINSFDKECKKILMIGDTFETDIRGSHNLGIDSALVMTGNMGRAIAGTKNLNQLEAANKICSAHNILPTYLITMK